jgi:hypothetical protein
MNDPDRIQDTDLQPATAPFQAGWSEWGRGYRVFAPPAANGSKTNLRQAEMIIRRCSSRDEAVSALVEIGEQGEGLQAAASGAGQPDGTGKPEEAHHKRLLDIYRGMTAVSKPSLIVFKVADNPHTEHFLDITRPRGLRKIHSAIGNYQAHAGTNVITHPVSSALAHLFNLRYRMLLVNLSHALRTSGSDDPTDRPTVRGALINRTFGEMYNLRSIAGLLVQLPLEPGSKSQLMAGPPFEMPYSLQLPDGESDRWLLHRDLHLASLMAINRSRTELEASKGIDTKEPIKRYLTALENAERTALEEVGDALTNSQTQRRAGAPA